MNRNKRVVRVIYHHREQEDRDYYEDRGLRNYMVMILPKSFDPQKEGAYEMRIDGGVNLAGNYTTCVGFHANNCTIEKPTIKDYLELSMALKYKHAYKSKNERRRG